MTETCSHQYTTPEDPPERVVDTCGRACSGYEVRIWRQDDPDIEAAPGAIGRPGRRSLRGARISTISLKSCSLSRT
jgi:acyl-CoA synthetase